MPVPRLFVAPCFFGCVVVFAGRADAACPAADLRDGARRAVLAVEESRALRAGYQAERATTFAAVRKSSVLAEPGSPGGDDSPPPSTLDAPLHAGATYTLSASAVDLCHGPDRVTMGAVVHGGVFAAETERWEGSLFVGERRVFTQTADASPGQPNVTYRGLVLAGTGRYREWVELTAGVMAPEHVETYPAIAAVPVAPVEPVTRGFLVSGVPGTHLSHAVVLSDGARPVVTTYLDAEDVRPFRAPVAFSGRVGYLDPTRQGFAAAGVALTLPALRVGVDASAESSPIRARHGRFSALLGGTHKTSRGGAYLSGGLRLALSRYVGRSIQQVSATGGAPGFEVGMFAGGGLPWFAMGVDARVGKSSPEQLAVLPAAHGNGEGSVRALVRVTPHVRKLPRTFRGPLDLAASPM